MHSNSASNPNKPSNTQFVVKVVLCICTCRRPTGLQRLLEEVAKLDFDAHLSVVVIENDAGREGFDICQNLSTSYRWPLTCVYENQPGISFARNTAVRIALDQEPDFVAMLDDDEWPSQQWLSELLRIRSEAGSDAVGGPHLPVFPPDSDPWAKFADYYGFDQRRQDGESCILYSSGNFLAKADCFRSLMPTPFDLSFAKLGGEDMVFFRRLAERGYQMCWSANGHVYESVPESRMSLAWLKRRQIRRGNINVIVQRMFTPGPIYEAIRLGKTFGLLVIGSVFYVVALPHYLLRIRASLLLYKAQGKIIGHFGRQTKYLEYG